MGWVNPIPAVQPADGFVLRQIFASLEQWSGDVGGAGTPATLLYGSTDPTPSTGVDTNFYLNSTTMELFGPKASGVWPSGVSLIGSTGTAGPSGPTGAQGPMGGTFDIEGGAPGSVYGGTTTFDAGGV